VGRTGRPASAGPFWGLRSRTLRGSQTRQIKAAQKGRFPNHMSEACGRTSRVGWTYAEVVAVSFVSVTSARITRVATLREPRNVPLCESHKGGGRRCHGRRSESQIETRARTR